MDMETDKAPDWWDELSDQQKEHILKGLDDARNGRVMSSKEFWKRLKNDESRER